MTSDSVRSSEVVIAPSILAADFGRLADEVRAAEAGGAGVIHLDVMDGHFVPNLTMGPSICQAVRAVTRLPIDVHLMVEDADRWLAPFRDGGADWISVHVEAAPHLNRTVQRIRELGASPGVVLNPASSLTLVDEILAEVDYVLVMSVNPGFGGQSFIEGSIDRIRRLRDQIGQRGLATRIEVDGGIGMGNARAVAEAGAEILVAGSAVFGGGEPEKATRRLHLIARGERVE